MPASAPRLIEVVREQLALHHASPRTVEAYVSWIRRYVRHFRGRHPREMGESEVTKFLTCLAVARHVAIAYQRRYLVPSVSDRSVGTLRLGEHISRAL